jgi:hypothetical protein
MGQGRCREGDFLSKERLSPEHNGYKKGYKKWLCRKPTRDSIGK